MEFKLENLCGFLIRSKLMTPNEMLSMRQRWAAEAKDAAHVPLFLRWLVAKNYVTEYQAGLLSKGHVDDFFLGDYKILERIGRGRMAGVYRAVHPLGQVVAIKVLPPSRARNPLMLGRFQREARLAIKLKHPNVVRAFQVGETKSLHYLVMEYLEGEPLDEILQRRKRLPAGEAVRLVHQALLGLQHLHEQGMVHRDLKPANLMLFPASARGANETTLLANVKILDIGLAREFFDEDGTAHETQAELTGEGAILGTPDYLAPEQARDPRNIDIRADIYSLGCTLYHLLAGQPPFPDANVLNQMIRHATETPRPLTDFVPTLPEGLTQIVSWMIAKEPAKRYPTPTRAAQALDAFLMVAGEAPKAMQESVEMKMYLTWLESEEPSVAAAPAAKTPAAVATTPSPKPASHPGTPIAAAKPKTMPDVAVPMGKTPAPQTKSGPIPKKRKDGTGVKIPAMPVPANPVAAPPPVVAPPIAAPPIAAPPIAAPLVASPPVAAPSVAPSPPAAPAVDPPVVAAPVPAAAAEQLDVELVDVAATPRKGIRLSARDGIMLGIGIGAMLILYGFCTVVSWVVGRFGAE